MGCSCGCLAGACGHGVVWLGAQTTGGEGTTTSSAPSTRIWTDAPVLPSPVVPGEDPSAADQEDWAAQTGDAWDLFNTGYLEGWQTGYDDLFGNSPDGNLYVVRRRTWFTSGCQAREVNWTDRRREIAPSFPTAGSLPPCVQGARCSRCLVPAVLAPGCASYACVG